MLIKSYLVGFEYYSKSGDIIVLAYEILKKDENTPKQTKNLTYDYVNAYTESPVRTSSERKGKYRCMFIGGEYDKFHFALYYGK